MPPRILQAIVEEEEQDSHVQSEEDPSQDNKDVEERLRTILGTAIQATPQSPLGHVDRQSSLPLSQLLNPIDPMPCMIRTNTPEGVDYSGLPYLNNRLYVKPQGEIQSPSSPSNLLQLESHFNYAYEASLAAAAAAAERDPPVPVPASSPLSRWFGDLTTTPPPESSDEDIGGMREADELDSRSGSDSESDDSSDWWEEEEPASASAVLAPAPHLVLPFNIWRIEVSALQYTPPASPADREMVLAPSPLPRPHSLPAMAAPTRTPPPPPIFSHCGQDLEVSIKEAHSLPSPSRCGQDSEVPIKKEEEVVSSPLPLLRRYSRLRIKKEDEEEEDADNILSSSTIYQSPSEYSTTKEEGEGADGVKTEITEITMEEIQVAIKPLVEVEGEAEVNPKVKLEELVTSTLAPAPVLVPALASEPTTGAGLMVRKRSRSGWTSINGPAAKRRKFMN